MAMQQMQALSHTHWKLPLPARLLRYMYKESGAGSV
jgi:hypothetical protein